MKKLVNSWSAVGLPGIALLLIGAASAVHGQSRSQSPSLSSSLKIDIRPEQTNVRNTQRFVVHTKISNIGSEVQALEVWSCSYNESWKSDHPAAFVNTVPCRANAPLNLQLKPGEAYERDLSVYVLLAADKLQQESLTFRLGFKPWIIRADKSLSFIWSNPVTVKVVENLPPGQ